jgi:hypothetical protein
VIFGLSGGLRSPRVKRSKISNVSNGDERRDEVKDFLRVAVPIDAEFAHCSSMDCNVGAYIEHKQTSKSELA